MALLVLVASSLALLASVASPCPTSCLCRWKGGKETAECIGLGLTALPQGVSVGTRALDLSNNNLRQLPANMFVASGLLNLQRIYLASCKIGLIDDDALSRLTNLVELDLANNLITAVPSETFKDVPSLRRLVLADNPIARVESGAFERLVELSFLDLSRCRVEVVQPSAFDGLAKLQSLKLDNNRLATLPLRALTPLHALQGVELHDNPWRCDCHLRELRHWMDTSGVPTPGAPLTCHSPPALSGTYVQQVPISQLACGPRTLSVAPGNRHVRVVTGHSINLLCRVAGVPEPVIRWLRDGRVVANLSRSVLIRENGTNDKVSVLSVGSAADSHAGEYVCVGENNAGTSVANFSVAVDEAPPQVEGAMTSSQVAGIGVGLGLLCLIAGLLACTCFVRWRQTQARAGKPSTTVTTTKLSIGKPGAIVACTDLQLQAEQRLQHHHQQHHLHHNDSNTLHHRHHNLNADNGGKNNNPNNRGGVGGAVHQNNSTFATANNANMIMTTGGGGAAVPQSELHHQQRNVNKPDVVNVIEEVGAGDHDDEMGGGPDEKRPDLHESLKYSPQSPLHRNHHHHDHDHDHDGWEKDGGYDYDGLAGADGWHYDLPTTHAHPQFGWRDLHPKSGATNTAASGGGGGGGFRFRPHLVPVLPPFPAGVAALRVSRSPDEGCEDEGGDGTEV